MKRKNMEKTDVHAHIISGIDDGAENAEESMAMLKLAAVQGFRKFIATPHYSPQYRNLCPEYIQEECRRLEEQAQACIHPDIRIYPGQEIYYEDGVMEKLDKGKLLTLAGSSYVLMEFAVHVSYSELYRSLQRLRLEGYYPVLAHAERYPALRKEENSLEELEEAGVLIQLNYGSLQGAWWQETARWCRKQIKAGRIHFLGTDMHDAVNRPPHTERTFAWMERYLDKERLEALCYGNAERLLKNESI